MTNDSHLPGQLTPTPRILMGPGPSDVHPRVLQAMAAPCIGHLDPEFLRIMDETGELLRTVFKTRNRLTIPVSATGSAGMEACVVNLVEPGDEVVICVNGVFGQRMSDVAQRAGAKVVNATAPWGRIIEPDQVRAALAQTDQPKLVGIVHAETSTGVHQPLTEISDLAHEHGALFLVDTVTSLGGTDVRVDEWKIDAVYSGTQKCLSCPPGLSPISFSEQALNILHNRKTKVQSWYLDLTMIAQYWGEERVYHHTAPVNAIYGLREALRLCVEEGLEARFERHRLNHLALKAGLAALGIEYLAQEGHQLPMLNAVSIPEGVADGTVRKSLLQDYNLEIGAGLGEFKGRAWRIGLMGYASSRNNVVQVLAGLGAALRAAGRDVDPGTGVGAALEFYGQ